MERMRSSPGVRGSTSGARNPQRVRADPHAPERGVHYGVQIRWQDPEELGMRDEEARGSRNEWQGLDLGPDEHRHPRGAFGDEQERDQWRQ